MKPYIICHMLSSVDGRTDGDSLEAVTREGEYEATSATFKGGAWICGRTTMHEILGNDEPFVSVSNQPAGPQPAHVARRAESYAVAVDTLGKLRWTSGDLRGDHLICLLSERVPVDYLALLREKGVSPVRASIVLILRKKGPSPPKGFLRCSRQCFSPGVDRATTTA